MLDIRDIKRANALTDNPVISNAFTFINVKEK